MTDGDPLNHCLTVEQNQATARDQQENEDKRQGRKSHNSPLDIHIDDLVNNECAYDCHSA